MSWNLWSWDASNLREYNKYLMAADALALYMLVVSPGVQKVLLNVFI